MTPLTFPFFFALFTEADLSRFAVLAHSRALNNSRNWGSLRLWIPFAVNTPVVSRFASLMLATASCPSCFLFSPAFFAPSERDLYVSTRSRTVAVIPSSPPMFNVNVMAEDVDEEDVSTEEGTACSDAASLMRDGCSSSFRLGGNHPRSDTAFIFPCKFPNDLWKILLRIGIMSYGLMERVKRLVYFHTSKNPFSRYHSILNLPFSSDASPTCQIVVA